MRLFGELHLTDVGPQPRQLGRPSMAIGRLDATPLRHSAACTDSEEPVFVKLVPDMVCIATTTLALGLPHLNSRHQQFHVPSLDLRCPQVIVHDVHEPMMCSKNIVRSVDHLTDESFLGIAEWSGTCSSVPGLPTLLRLGQKGISSACPLMVSIARQKPWIATSS